MYINIKKNVILSIVFFTFAQTLLFGCGIYSFTGASLCPEDKTVSVKYFVNRAPLINPALSQEFTEMLKDKFSTQTVLDLTNIDGDLQFEGEITGYSVKAMEIAKGQTAKTNRLTISVTVRFKSIYCPEKNFDKKFSRYADFPSEQSLTEVEAGLVNEIIEQISDDVFNEAVVNW